MEEQLFEFVEQLMPLTAAEKAAILQFDVFRSYAEGTVLLREGQVSNQSYFVLKGSLRTYYLLDGEERTTDFYLEMDALSPETVLTQGPSPYTIVCMEDSILCVSTPDMEYSIFEQFPRLQSLCLMQSELLLLKKQQAFSAFKHASPEQRYLDLLQHRPQLLQKAPQHQIASYLGIKPESLSRIRKRLKENTSIGS